MLDWKGPCDLNYMVFPLLVARCGMGLRSFLSITVSELFCPSAVDASLHGQVVQEGYRILQLYIAPFVRRDPRY